MSICPLRGISTCRRPLSLVSIFSILSLIKSTLDRKLAQHWVGLYLEDAPSTQNQDFLVRKPFFIPKFVYKIPASPGTLSLHRLRPIQSPPGHIRRSRRRTRQSLPLRNMGDDPRASEKRITATTRQLESII